MSKPRDYRRSKDGIHWSKITFQRMKQDAWKASPGKGHILIKYVMGGGNLILPNGYTYRRIAEPEQEVTE